MSIHNRTAVGHIPFMAERIDANNPELQQALQIIQFTRQSLFLTGKAGTGKSTFLRHIAATTKKKYVVLAPTGIAAINAGGTTLHSFFKLPFHPLLPNDSRYSPRNIRNTLRYNSEKIKLINQVELIIIDEISMVRADIIDFIDKVLRIYCRNMREPFGGKQLLLVGDIYQLEPVLRDEDRQLLNPFYPSPYFFDAKVFREIPLVSIELQKVYRQSDAVFISILDRIRTSQADDTDFQRLNTRVVAYDNTTPHSTSDYSGQSLAITLSTRHDTVDFINRNRLAELPGAPTMFQGIITGEFPESNLPTSMQLELKPGAQILFVKNDKNKRWVNGTLGTITGFDDDEYNKIYVVTEDGRELDVEREIWSNIRYTFNEEEKRIEEQQIGTFEQYPLRLAWAITVHKSQGLTFKNVKIDLTGGAFAAGQTYVALSRCTSLEGITLRAPIRKEDVFVRTEVKQFARNYNNTKIIDKALQQSKADAEYRLALQAFDEDDFEAALHHFFIAIHARYDIEKPAVKRLIRKKLSTITLLKQKIQTLKDTLNAKEQYLKQLAVEYTVMGRECEKEGMAEAAMRNYRKALELCPDIPEAARRLKRLQKKR